MISNYTAASGQYALTFNETAPAPFLGCAADLKVNGSFFEPLTIFGVLNGTSQVARSNATFGRHGAWYEIFPTVGMNVSLSVVSLTEELNTTLSVSYGSCDNQTLVTLASTTNNATFIATEQSYYVYVTAFGNATSGSYYLNITEEINYSAQPGFSRNNSISLPGPGLYANQTNMFAANITATGKLAEGQYPARCYHMSLPSMSDVIISTCSPKTKLDTAVLVFDEESDDVIAFNDDFGCGINAAASKVTVSTTDEGRDFFVAVVGFNGTVGAFDLDVRMKHIN